MNDIDEALEKLAAAAEEALKELKKLEEEYERVDDDLTDDQHDGAVVILTIWLPPTPNLQKLYGQGIDYGGTARPVRG